MNWWEECQWRIHAFGESERYKEEALRKFAVLAEEARQAAMQKQRRPREQKPDFTAADIAMLKQMGIAV